MKIDLTEDHRHDLIKRKIVVLKHFRNLDSLIIIFSLIILGCSYSNNCLAFSPEGYKLTKRDKAFCIYFVDNNFGWILGDNGLVLKTTNGGDRWERVFISDDDTFNDICFSGYKGWIVGGGGVIYHTDDRGVTWKRQSEADGKTSSIKLPTSANSTCPKVTTSTHFQQNLMKVFFIDQDTGITVGADGTILRTENGGISWGDVSPDWGTLIPMALIERGVVSINLYDIHFLSENTGWIVGDWGTIVYTTDGGKTWTLSHIGTFPPLFSISFKNNQKGLAVGQNGFAVKTNNGGTTWTKVGFGTEKSLYGIQFNNDYGVIVGDQATMFKTDDGGVTWNEINLDLQPPHPWIVGAWILPSNPTKILSVGKGMILKTWISSKR